MEDKTKVIISLCVGIILGCILGGFCSYRVIVNIPGEQFGSIAEWLSGIGSSGAVIFSLCITLLRRRKVKVAYQIRGEIIRSQKKVDLNSLYVTFIAFNQTNIPVGLKFYGFRKHKNEEFLAPDGVDYEKVYEVKPGDSLEYGIYVKDLIRMYHLENYKGKIEVGFAEVNGHLYSKNFRKSSLKIKKKNFKNLLDVKKNSRCA